MNIETKIYINNDLDIVMARMQAREAAKEMGFSTADQARISLAASELARMLSWTIREPSEIVISKTNRNGQEGLQVVCMALLETISPENEAGQDSAPSRSFAGACRLVDESSVDVQNAKQARVTLIKWLS